MEPNKNTQVTGWGVLFAIGILIACIIYGCNSYKTTTPSSDTYSNTSAQTENDTELANKVAEFQAAELKWNYSETDDEMGRGKIKSATVHSSNQFHFNFPYQEEQRATLQLRIHPKYGHDVILFIENGQFLCDIDSCKVAVRFDEGDAQSFNAVEPDDYSTTALFIRDYNRMIAGLRKANKVYIEAKFFQEGTRVFEFDVSGLEW
ncbi:MAG: hypothetical protein WCX65_14590 [bacterium]